MGGSVWSDDHYADRAAHRAATNTPAFAYTAKVASGAVKAGTHDLLNPKGVIRESRDSKEHPESVAIAVCFDVTGSMGQVPTIMQTKLPQLMGLLLRKGYVTDPQVMFAAVGDYHSDVSPLQVGQFESGIEMEDAMSHMFLEGNGGGQNQESYELALYFFGHKTSIDCFEKRGKKGYLFMIGDEHAYPNVTRDEIESVLGDKVEAHVPVAEAVRAAQEKYEVFFIIPKGTTYFSDPKLKKHWQELVGAERVIMLEDPAAVCETIASTIGLIEGTTDIAAVASDLKDVGVSAAIVRSVTNALDPLAANALAMAAGGGLAKSAGVSGNERL